MNIRNIRSWVITLAMAAGLVSLSPLFGAQNPNQRQHPPNAEQPAQNQPHTYTGKIVKTKTGKFALLTDPQNGKGFLLDDQKDAQKYDQQNVKIVATLDPNTMMLHVINIEPVS